MKISGPITGPISRGLYRLADALGSGPQQAVQPAPSGPLDRLIPSGVNGYSTPYTNANQVIHVRLAYINGAASTPTIGVTLDGNPMTFIGRDGDAAIGAAGVIAFFLTGITPGAHTIALTVSSGAVTMAALRIGELVSQTSIGVVSAPHLQTNPTYYIELDGPEAAGPGQVGTIACFNNAGAYAVYPSYGDTEQWNTFQTGMAARFATGARPSGEGGTGLFVFYTRNGASYNGAALAYEIIGGVLP